jgi:hypothetical protein
MVKLEGTKVNPEAFTVTVAAPRDRGAPRRKSRVRDRFRVSGIRIPEVV